ncbi:BsuPI-related putative proteinase inhibitor [Neobacillus vireti]|uniref:BsuPI-related putative proteinase inhibitor n=1 Tax=Neobacillus vireti TaxID=220686 RepID=UPI002FFF7FCA
MKSRQFVYIVLLLLTFSLLAACGSQKSDTNQTNESPEPNHHTNEGTPSPGGIANFGVEGSLELKEAPSGMVFVFTLKNQSEQVKELVFPSALEYDYIVRDATNTVVKQRSKEMAGDDRIVVTKLKQGEELVYKEDFTKLTKDLPKGTYTIEFRSNAKKQDIKASLPFTIK